MKNTVKTIISAKGARKLAMLTAYDSIFSTLADNAGVDMILVGDSVGNTTLGFSSTVPVTLDMMAHHTAAVARSTKSALVIADMPFAVAHRKFDSLLDAAVRLVQQSGADAVKIEGGEKMAKKISKLVDAGIAVMGHIGLEPQQVLRLGGYRKFGKTEDEKERIMRDAKALEAAGVFAIVMEMTDAQLAAEVSRAVSVPTIGIGSGAECDGQVLVFTDVLGLSQNPPKFAKQYADLTATVSDAYAKFIDDVRNAKFPEKK